MKTPVPEPTALERELELHEASEDLLEALDQREQMYLVRQAEGASAELKSVRHLTMHFLAEARQLCGATWETWFQAANLLDAASPADSELGSAFVCAAAAWLICLKYEERSARSCNLRVLIEGIADCATLCAKHVGGPEVTREALLSEERRLMKVGCLHLGAPTLHLWITRMLTRFQIITKCALGAEVPFLLEWANQVAMVLVSKHPPAVQCRPRALASSLLSLLLVAASLIDFKALLPPGTDPTMWEQPVQFTISEVQAELSRISRARSELGQKAALCALYSATGASPEVLHTALPPVLESAYYLAWRQRQLMMQLEQGPNQTVEGKPPSGHT